MQRDENNARPEWTFHFGWALFCFARLVWLSWRLCMRTRGKRVLNGDTLSLDVSTWVTVGDAPEPPHPIAPIAPIPLEHRSLH